MNLCIVMGVFQGSTLLSFTVNTLKVVIIHDLQNIATLYYADDTVAISGNTPNIGKQVQV